MANENRALMRQAFDQLSQTDVERANWLGAVMNFKAGHTQAAQASLSKVGSDKALVLHRAWLADQLGERGLTAYPRANNLCFSWLRSESVYA